MPEGFSHFTWVCQWYFTTGYSMGFLDYHISLTFVESDGAEMRLKRSFNRVGEVPLLASGVSVDLPLSLPSLLSSNTSYSDGSSPWLSLQLVQIPT